jgi:hypothetical protein
MREKANKDVYLLFVIEGIQRQLVAEFSAKVQERVSHRQVGIIKLEDRGRFKIKHPCQAVDPDLIDSSW